MSSKLRDTRQEAPPMRVGAQRLPADTRFNLESLAALLTAFPFLATRLRYYGSLRKAPSPPGNTEYLKRLNRDGVVVIPGFIDRATIESMVKAIPGQDGFELSVEGDGALFYRNAHTLQPFKPFFENSTIRDIAKAYIGDEAVPIRRTVEWRRVAGRLLAFDRMYHMDSWKHRLKAFLYLHDIGEDEAPLTYLRGSHKGAWRLQMEARMNKYYQTGKGGYAISEEIAYVGCYWPYEVERLKRVYGLADISCTGAAGTLVLFDARGLHRATELRSPHRQILIDYWIQKGHHT